MGKRDWPEEKDWIRQQDQIMYKLINILSVAAILFLVCFVAYRAADAGSESVMAAGTSLVSEDAAPVEIIRLTVSDYQMTEAIASVQDTLQQAALEPDTVVMKVSEQDEQIEEESEYANPAIVQVSKAENNVSINPEACAADGTDIDISVFCEISPRHENNYVNARGEPNTEYFIYGDKTAVAEADHASHYAAVKADRLNVRGQPDLSAERIGSYDCGESALLPEDYGEWLPVQYTESRQGYISAEYEAAV